MRIGHKRGACMLDARKSLNRATVCIASVFQHPAGSRILYALYVFGSSSRNQCEQGLSETLHSMMSTFSLVAVALVLPHADAAHGLDNNWTVKVTGMVDANDCVRVTSIEDLGENIQTPSSVNCVGHSDTCSDDYSCEVARAKKPSTFAGCTLNSSTASEATVTGVLMDGLCYTNFVVEQKNFNGAPGLAPDKVHVRSEAHLHTRACLVVDYCAKTGFYLLQHSGEAGALTYTKLAQVEQGSGAEQVYDWLIEARHPCGTTTTAMPATSSHALSRWFSVMPLSAAALLASSC